MEPIKGEGANLSEIAPIVVGITGASGAPIAVRLLRALKDAREPVALIVSDGAVPVLFEECGMRPADLAPLASVTYSDHDLAAPIASGSNRTRAMAIVPCSGNTVAKVALGLGDTLLTRCAQVHLKERRPLVVVPRETPVSTTALRHLAGLSQDGVVVLPVAPPYYLHPRSIEDLTDYMAGKVLDHLGVAHRLYQGWRARGS